VFIAETIAKRTTPVKAFHRFLVTALAQGIPPRSSPIQSDEPNVGSAINGTLTSILFRLDTL
jgi:hypothetical protein